ncbi:MAG: DUF6265 family protein [Novosphingobium sp.]
MNWKCLAALALVSLSVPVLADDSRSMPGWLAGQWVMQDGTNWAEEMWLGPRGDAMLGIGREGFGPEVNSWEAMRIALKPGGKLVLFAHPKGNSPVEFAMTAASDDSIEFTNPAHSFPQRIRYWRQGQLLMAEISKMDGSEAKQWRYRPVAAGVP